MAQLNKHYQYILRTNEDPEFQTENAYEIIVKEKPYKILHTTSMLFKVSFSSYTFFFQVIND